MALSAIKKAILNKLLQYIPGLRKGQISPQDGGDIRLGDMLDGFRVQDAALATMALSPTDVAVADAEVGDLVVVTIVSDDTGATLGAVAGTIPADGTVRLTPAGGVTNNDGIVLWQLLKAQA